MSKCPYCAGTDVQHEIGEPCLFLQMEEDRERRRWAEEEAERERYGSEGGEE